MHDRDDDDDSLLMATKEVDELKTITFLLKGLHGHLKQEQEAISLASGQITFCTEQFKDHMARIEDFEQAYRKYVVDTVKDDLRQSAKIVANEIGTQVKEHSIAAINQTITNLTQLSGRVEWEFDRQAKAAGVMKRKFAVLLLLASLTSGLLGGWVVSHYSPEKSDESRRQMIMGGILQRAIPYLSQAEKSNIYRLGSS